MTLSSDFASKSAGPTTAVPGPIDIDAVMPELTTPQERYDNGFRRGYMAGYAEGARQASAERAADLASHKAAFAAAQAQAASLLGQLGSATERYLQVYGPRELELTEEAITTAFSLAEAVVHTEVRSRPDLALESARKVLSGLPTGPAVVRVNPADAALLEEPAAALGNNAQKVMVIADPAVGAGGCIVTSGATKVDARVSEALAMAREAFCAGAVPSPSQPSGGITAGAPGTGGRGR